MKTNFLLLFLVSAISVFAQSKNSEIITASSAMIKDGRYDAANLYLDSVLKKDANNVDALMMKGNVILNKKFAETPGISLVATDDESIFETSVGSMESTIRIIPVETARTIEKLWLQCLNLDNTRTDIHMGLCTLYGMALMKEELKKQIAAFVKTQKPDAELPYKLADYARKFKERDRFDDAMEIYQFIASLFPELAGIRGDIASEYFYRGNMSDALRYLDSALSKKNIDEMTYLNSAFTYSDLGYFDNAYICFDNFSKKYNTKMNLFYRGMMRFANNDSAFALDMKAFITTTDSNAYYPEYLLAKELLKYTSSFTAADALSITKGNFSEWYKPLIYTRALNRVPTNCEVQISYGVFHSSIRNYQAAVNFLKEGKNCTLDQEQKCFWLLNYGYALYMTGNKEEALTCFKQAMNSTNTFRQHAARYFTAKIFVEGNNRREAEGIIKPVIDSKEITKYVALARVLTSIKD